MSDDVRPIIDAIVRRLLARDADELIDLNDIEEAIGDRAVTYDEVDFIVARLEAAGRRVGEPKTAGEVEAIGVIVAAAHALRLELSRKPDVAEIAARCGLPERTVRRALEHVARMRSPRDTRGA